MNIMYKKIIFPGVLAMLPAFAHAAESTNTINVPEGFPVLYVLALVLGVAFLGVVIYKYYNFKSVIEKEKERRKEDTSIRYFNYLRNLDSEQIGTFLRSRKSKGQGPSGTLKSWAALVALLWTSTMMGQEPGAIDKPLTSQPGIIITIVLLLIPFVLGVVYAIVRAKNAIIQHYNRKKLEESQEFSNHIKSLEDPVLEQVLVKRKHALDYSLTNAELAAVGHADDSKGLILNPNAKQEIHFTAVKKKAAPRPSLEPGITKLILWYLGCAAFWLVIGTGIGEYLGIKFVSPDVDHVSWLSFGRLRPVHTNIVFWGWASLGMMGLGLYVVPTVSNTKLYSIRWGWIALILTNLMVILGTLCLMNGINNGGGEFREYIWPVTALFAVALILTLANFFMTVAKRSNKEIYISNWYVVSSIIFTIIVALTAYLPFWQNGVGETIVQGYYMHSGVGMWFTLFTLGLMYYFIPQQLNKPIYAYSLGILAFWTQILFYTIIGTHHFVFSAIPWWLQTVAIVGSAGMIIPVVAATINFTMTFRGQWHKVSHSYTLPFFLVAVIYYFVVSIQGTAEAFRFTNLLWHFTDFTVGHAHLGFYGIITFAIWGGAYAIIPRLTGKEPPHHLVGAHFWLAFIGLLFYGVPLMIGGTLRGMMWMEGKPFIDSVVMMFDFWLWRAIGGSLMFISHVVYFYNFYKMVAKTTTEVDVKEEAFKILDKELATETI
jgi:cytochrome c oxidase cbb3-type subunit 1